MTYFSILFSIYLGQVADPARSDTNDLIAFDRTIEQTSLGPKQ